ncbi:hypothetical protein [Streptomyces sp. NPDC059080]|uniref:hypothetical protein n=1 Tax=Streptomyces sp. NPDC059080 TaxID=3346718 RepID=UPI0036C4B5BD
MFVPDPFNNVRRLCSVRGDLSSYRRWQVKARVTGHRYLLRNLDTGAHRVVAHADLKHMY